MQTRFLDLHEYQAKGLMAKFNIRVQKGKVADTAVQAEAIAKELKGSQIDLLHLENILKQSFGSFKEYVDHMAHLYLFSVCYSLSCCSPYVISCGCC